MYTLHKIMDDPVKVLGIPLGIAGVVLLFTRGVTHPEDLSSIFSTIAAFLFSIAFLLTGSRCATTAIGQALIVFASLAFVIACILQAFVPSMS